MRRLSKAIAMCALLAAPALADEREFTVAGWQGSSYDSKGGGFSHCAISSSYRSGLLLLFSLNRNYDLKMGLADSRWSLVVGQTYPISYSIDGSAAITASAEAVTEKQVRIDLPDSERMLAQLKAGVLMTVRASGADFHFRLDGSSRALERLRECVAERNSDRTASSNPFALRSSNPFASRAQKKAVDLPKFFQIVFKQPGFEDYDILPASQAPEGLQNQDVVWSSASTVGGSTFWEREGGDQIKQLVGLVIASDNTSCAADFASTVQHLEMKGVPITKVRTACRETKAGGTFFVGYTFLPLKDGGVWRIATVATDQGSLDREDRLMHRILESLFSG